ncbi:MAG TPA: hypothetical protein VN794_21825 [Methylomirabilota bacterium]|nr:hypothetical protein [Methylomirabilota bacterium]
MYRPQFIFAPAPAPCEDQRCTYSFDAVNLPVFTGTLAAGQQTGRVPLRLDKDADFYLRGISQFGAVSVRLEDCEGNAISDSENALQAGNFMLPAEYGLTGGAGLVPLEGGSARGGEDGLFAPAGGNFVVYLFNNTAADIDLTDCAISLHGIKRFPGASCQ